MEKFRWCFIGAYPLTPPAAAVGVLELMDECRRQMGLQYPFE